MLNVLPTPIYLLPDDNVARYLGHRAVNIGTTWAAEIQRAPLTKTEQFFKRCFRHSRSCLRPSIALAINAIYCSSDRAELIRAGLVLAEP